MADVSVIVPTYRERDNLARLLPALFGIFYQSAFVGEVIVVDDGSDDGTEVLCSTLATVKPVRLLTRRGERGLATAVVQGLNVASGEICVVMDADFSHPPEAVPQLVSAVRGTDCELAIGSRYTEGGAIDAEWSWFRRVNSRMATMLARGLTNVKDPMSGFFAIRRDVLARGGYLKPLGYKIALELIVRCDCRQIVEVPIKFQDRAVGESKMSLRQQWLYLRHLRRLYTARYLRRRVARHLAPDVEPSRRAA